MSILSARMLDEWERYLTDLMRRYWLDTYWMTPLSRAHFLLEDQPVDEYVRVGRNHLVRCEWIKAVVFHPNNAAAKYAIVARKDERAYRVTPEQARAVEAHLAKWRAKHSVQIRARVGHGIVGHRPSMSLIDSIV